MKKQTRIITLTAIVSVFAIIAVIVALMSFAETPDNPVAAKSTVSDAAINEVFTSKPAESDVTDVPETLVETPTTTNIPEPTTTPADDTTASAPETDKTTAPDTMPEPIVDSEPAVNPDVTEPAVTTPVVPETEPVPETTPAVAETNPVPETTASDTTADEPEETATEIYFDYSPLTQSQLARILNVTTNPVKAVDFAGSDAYCIKVFTGTKVENIINDVAHCVTPDGEPFDLPISELPIFATVGSELTLYINIANA